MFTYFHQHKCRYDKGQIAPIMILVLVILIIMALVTVNLYKVAMDKTYSANGVDAGALAGGSVMANVFNSLASGNAKMKAEYELAYYSITGSFGLALGFLGAAAHSTAWSIKFAARAAELADPAPCGAIGFAAEAAGAVSPTPMAAIGQMKIVTSTITSLIIATSALYAAQLYFYGKLRKTVDEGRQSAIEQGHKFLFYNSGAGSRLPEAIPEGSSWTKSRKDYSRFIDNIKYADNYRFDWQDGQARQHFIASKITTDELDTYELIVTAEPFLAILGFLIAARALSMSAKGALIDAGALYAGAKAPLTAACVAMKCCLAATGNPPCCDTWYASAGEAISALTTAIVSAGIALGLMTGTVATLGTAWAGLLPVGRISSDSSMSAPAILFIICWIDDINRGRTRQVRVESALSQEGADMGLVKTEYPVVQSYSIVDFKGSGKILPDKSEDLSFDASIIETDVIKGKE